ncbi:hypothetical protein [Amycolatopsis sp. NPDC051372]|uniref:hypothetical protein n=1 Tax=Amycolatopsis sp. NPDC051372 TaxID=3155669 RepID=UPI00342B6CBB
MRCADRTVSYGFPRPASGPGNKQNILQFRGTEQRAHVVYNEVTGDIATIYTEPAQDNWHDCAYWAPGAAVRPGPAPEVARSGVAVLAGR